VLQTLFALSRNPQDRLHTIHSIEQGEIYSTGMHMKTPTFRDLALKALRSILLFADLQWAATLAMLQRQFRTRV